MNKYTKDNVLIMEFDLRKIKTMNHFLREMSEFFEFPQYFGGNFDAMDDCMRDLSWFEEQTIDIYFLHLEDLQQKEKMYQEIKEILTFYQDFWQKSDEKSVRIIF